MRFAGVDIASLTHVIAIMTEIGKVLVKPTSFGEDAAGYEKAFALLGPSTDVLVVMEATGHYGRNFMAALWVRGYQLALINPIRTRLFAHEDLRRAKNDPIDALGLARFGIHALHVSARTGEGIAQLAELVATSARAGHVELRLRLPHREAALLAALEASAQVLERAVGDEATLLRALVPPALAGRVRDFVVADEPA